MEIREYEEFEFTTKRAATEFLTYKLGLHKVDKGESSTYYAKRLRLNQYGAPFFDASVSNRKFSGVYLVMVWKGESQ